MSNLSREDIERLFEKYRKPLVAYINVRINGKLSDAEDIAHKACVKLLSKINIINIKVGDKSSNDSFYGYLIGIAKNLIKDWFEEMSRSPAQLPADSSIQMDEPIDTHQSALREELDLRLAAYSELFRIAFLCGGYPYEQLVFAFSKHIYGQESSRAIEGSLAKFDSNHKKTLLSKLLEEYWQTYKFISHLGDNEIQRMGNYLEPIRVRMKLKVKELVELAPVLLAHYQNLLNEEVGRTTLYDYYANLGRSPGDIFSDWCYGVEDKVRRVFGVQKGAMFGKTLDDVEEKVAKGPIIPHGCSHCKLRAVPPCHIEGKNKILTSREKDSA
ncbi:MAG: RNA polymerase sigma factor [Phycisphaerae bacterium]|jgi:DNA-directed RNA polymerase specialized sigma24 family protein